MKGSLPNLLSLLLNNIELILTALGLVVIVVVPALIGRGQTAAVTAMTATAVGTLHGLIFWIVRRRQRQVRQQTITEVRLMMQDMIKNQLSIIMTSNYLATRHPGHAAYSRKIDQTAEEISSALDNLSEESLTRWQRRYHLDNQELRAIDDSSMSS